MDLCHPYENFIAMEPEKAKKKLLTLQGIDEDLLNW
jgi:hypothetical protein